MTNVPVELIAEAERLGSELPLELAQEIAASKNALRLLESISPAERRESLLHLYHRWIGLPAGSFAFALLTAAIAADRRRREHSMELVWTGPESRVIPVRQTQQVLLNVINRARKSLLIVSYAVSRIKPIRQAIVAAAGRGVCVRVVVDVDDEAGEGAYDTRIALGRDVAACSDVYYWPTERQRITGMTNQRGKLHVKCVVADRTELFVSSANLTRQALHINMELGLLVKAEHAARVDDHFTALIGLGVLRRVEAVAATA